MSDEVTAYDRAIRQFGELEGKPFLVKGAVDFLETVVNKESVVLEIGSGSSTIWFAERAGRVISFESDKVWFQLVWDELTAKELNNTVVYLGDDMTVLDPNDRFDICLIDGESGSRVAFTKKTLPLMKPGGYFVFDNTQHENEIGYGEAIRIIDGLGWERRDFEGTGCFLSDIIWMTTIWRKHLD